MGGDTEPCKPVHETAADSGTGEEQARCGAVLVESRHRSGMDTGGLSADSQEWCARHRWSRRDGIRIEPRSELAKSSWANSFRQLQSSSGTQGVHTQSGRHAKAAWYPDGVLIMHLLQRTLGMRYEFCLSFVPSYGAFARRLR